MALRIRPAVGLALGAPSRWAAAAAVAAFPACRPQQRGFSTSPSSPSSSSLRAPAAPRNRVPAPIPLVPDVATFLSVIGRNMKQHTAKFPTWEALFTLTSPQLRELGIEPPRDRRYLLRWLQHFRQGEFGIGGDFRYVRDGVAVLRTHEDVDPADPVNVRKSVVNVAAAPAPEAATDEAAGDAASAEASAEAPPVRVRGYKVSGARAVAGPYALPLKQQQGAMVTVTEGMWEHRRGRKIDGGERRRAEVRFKRRAVERRAARDQHGA